MGHGGAARGLGCVSETSVSEERALSITADGAGGAEVREQLDVERVFTGDAGLWALDVLHCPNLRVLDLRGARPGVRVRIGGCPALRRIEVPAQGPGAVLHLDFGMERPALVVEGAIDLIDACGWWEGQARTLETRSARQVGMRSGASVGPRPSFGAYSPQIVVVVGGATAVARLPKGTPVRELVVVGDGALERLHAVAGVPLLHVCLGGCPRLTTVRVTPTVARLEIDDAPRLTSVRANSTHVGIRRCGSVAKLEVIGLFGEVFLSYVEAEELDCRFADSLRLFLCTRLRLIRSQARLSGVLAVTVAGPRVPAVEGRATVQVQPLSRESIAEVFEHQEPATQEALIAWAATRRQPDAMVTALQVLLAAARAGQARARLWTIRNERRAVSVPALRPGGPWAWLFPQDLGDRGWSADLELWLLCRNDVAADYREVLARSGEPVHLAAFGRALLRHEREPALCDELMELLGRALRHGCEQGGRLDLGGRKGDKVFAPGVGAPDFGDLRIAVSALAHLRSHPECPARVEELCRWLLRRMPDRAGIELLGAMRQLGSRAATQALQVRLQGSVAGDEEMRRFALFQSLLPVREPVLSFDEKVSREQPSAFEKESL